MKLQEDTQSMWEGTRSDCAKCAGLCCTALFFSEVDGFPQDKAAGVPCVNLCSDHRCTIHAQLEQKGMRGCIAYDCFGAGQHVTQVLYQGKTWRDLPQRASEIFDVFSVVFQLRQIQYFFIQALLLQGSSDDLKNQLRRCLEENIQLCQSSPGQLLALDLEGYRSSANILLKQACQSLQQALHSQNKPCPKEFFGKSFRGKNMGGLDLSMKLLIAADFSECSFDGTIFLGADTRDANFSNADLRQAAFLTQGQINAAKGTVRTKIPAHLMAPETWK